MGTKIATAEDIHQLADGYIVNSGLSLNSQQIIKSVQNIMIHKFGDSIWAVPANALHITLLDLFTPSIDYGHSIDSQFAKQKQKYNKVLSDILRDIPPIEVMFNCIEVHPAAIIIRGEDNGSYKKIRTSFMQMIDLPDLTKQPPTIIHVTIGKFIRKIPLSDVESLMIDEKINFEETVKAFRLVHEHKIFMQDYDTLKKYNLQ